jgi:hypothetical protein
MQPRKNERYNFGWSDISYGAVPVEPSHTRTVFFELDNDGTPYTSRFSQAIIHNDHIHRASDNATNY